MLDQVQNHSTLTVYVAIELSKKSWVVAIMQPANDQPSIHRIRGGAVSDLVFKLRAAARNGERLLVCYEAGYDGFWLARSLRAEGIECRVLDPASLQVNRRARRVKTDRIDVLMLVRALMAVERGDRHVCAMVRVPSVEEEDARRSHREHQRLVRERTAHINRINRRWPTRSWRARRAFVGCCGAPRWLRGDHVQRQSLLRRSRCASYRLARREPNGNPTPDSTVAFNPLDRV